MVCLGCVGLVLFVDEVQECMMPETEFSERDPGGAIEPQLGDGIYFITGNSGKIAEAQRLLPGIQSQKLQLGDEIQETDLERVIAAKVETARLSLPGTPLIVEDTSLVFSAMGDLPGPLIKWFEDSALKLAKADQASLTGDDLKRASLKIVAEWAQHGEAVAKTVIGYTDGGDDIQFFHGQVVGTIVDPRGDGMFGWDPIFVPVGHARTFAEMAQEEKNAISMRGKAFAEFAKYLRAAQ